MVKYYYPKVEFSELELPADLRAEVLSPEEARGHARGHEKSGDETRIGLILPAPAVAAWDLPIPPDAELRFAPAVIQRSPSDGEASPEGFTLHVEVETEDGISTLYSQPIRTTHFEAVRIDLSRWGGQHVRLRMRTSSARRVANEIHFVAQPTIVRLGSQPRRVAAPSRSSSMNVSAIS